MPYLKQNTRDVLDGALNDLIRQAQILTKGGESWAGIVNYCATRLTLGVLPKVDYAHLSQAVGTLYCTAAEFYRRKVAPYEDQKVQENGDVFPPASSADLRG